MISTYTMLLLCSLFVKDYFCIWSYRDSVTVICPQYLCFAKLLPIWSPDSDTLFKSLLYDCKFCMGIFTYSYICTRTSTSFNHIIPVKATRGHDRKRTRWSHCEVCRILGLSHHRIWCIMRFVALCGLSPIMGFIAYRVCRSICHTYL